MASLATVTLSVAYKMKSVGLLEGRFYLKKPYFNLVVLIMSSLSPYVNNQDMILFILSFNLSVVIFKFHLTTKQIFLPWKQAAGLKSNNCDRYLDRSDLTILLLLSFCCCRFVQRFSLIKSRPKLSAASGKTLFSKELILIVCLLDAK